MQGFVEFWFDQLWNNNDDTNIEKWVSNPFNLILGGEKVIETSHRANAEFLPVFAKRFDPFHFEVCDQIVSGNKLAVRYRCEAKYRGHWLEIQGNGEPVIMTGILWFEFKDGKMCQCWLEDSDFDLYQQLTGYLE